MGQMTKKSGLAKLSVTIIIAEPKLPTSNNPVPTGKEYGERHTLTGKQARYIK